MHALHKPIHALLFTLQPTSSIPQRYQSNTSSTPSSNTSSTGTSWSNNTGNITETIARLQSTYSKHKPKLLFYIRISGGILFLYTLFTGTMYIIDFFTTINFLDVGQAMFIAGFIVALGMSGVIYGINRLITIKPDTVYNLVTSRILNPANTYYIQTHGILGDQLQLGEFRAYSYIKPSWRSAIQRKQYTTQLPNYSIKSIWLRYYQPKRLQLFFSLNGSKGQGIVSCEVENQFTGSARPRFILLSIDNITTQQRVVLYGDANYSIYRGIIKLR